MASFEATVEKRVRAMQRIQAALPGVRFTHSRGGPEHQHATHLEDIANHLEAQQRSSRKASTAAAAKSETATAAAE